MPTSDYHNISPILAILGGLQPKRVLDVGCGFGKYGVLIREYFDIWQERLNKDEWQLQLVGIEAYEQYRNPIHDYVYNAVHYGEAQAILPTLDPFDAILIVDVIEHLEKAQAIKLVEDALAKSPVVIVSTPREFYAQGDLCGNPYEIHRNLFTQDDFPEGASVQPVEAVACVIYVASREPLDPAVFTLTDPVDHVYLRSRYKLGKAGLPISAGLRMLNRLLT